MTLPRLFARLAARLVLLAVLVRCAPARTPPRSTGSKPVRGVAILLSTYEEADVGEATLYEMAADQKDIDHIAIASTREEFFQIFTDYRRAGISMDKLVVMGHGQKDEPALKFGASEYISVEQVDLEHARKQRDHFAALAEECRRDRKACTSFQKYVREKNERFWQRSAQGLEDMRHVMTAGAEVRMMNCGLAYSERGRKIVRHLGDLLLGERGGSINSSRTNLQVGQIKNYLDMVVSLRDFGKWKSKGEYFVENAEWIRMDVAPRVERHTRVPGAVCPAELQQRAARLRAHNAAQDPGRGVSVKTIGGEAVCSKEFQECWDEAREAFRICPPGSDGTFRGCQIQQGTDFVTCAQQEIACVLGRRGCE